MHEAGEPEEILFNILETNNITATVNWCYISALGCPTVSELEHGDGDGICIGCEIKPCVFMLRLATSI